MTLQSHSWAYMDLKKTNLKRYMHPNVHSNTIHDRPDIKATSVSINRGMDKDVVHTYNGVLFSQKEE